MFNSTVQGAAGWILPRYFDYDIVNGRAGTSVEWIRIYVPGQWHPVAPDTLGPAPDDSTTYRAGSPGDINAWVVHILA